MSTFPARPIEVAYLFALLKMNPRRICALLVQPSQGLGRNEL